MNNRHVQLRKNGKNTPPPLPVVPRLTKEEIISRVNDLAGSLCDSEGMELIHVEYQRESTGNVLRVFIDKPGGVFLQDCAHISRQLSDLLDIHMDIKGDYHLEISSPGINRQLGKLSDFIKFEGQQATIRICRPIDGQKNFTGVLSGVSEEAVVIQTNDRIIKIPYQDITRARLVNYNGDI